MGESPFYEVISQQIFNLTKDGFPKHSRVTFVMQKKAKCGKCPAYQLPVVEVSPHSAQPTL